MSGMSNITEPQQLKPKKSKGASGEDKKEEEEAEEEHEGWSPMIGAKCRGLGVALNPSTHGSFFDGGIDMEKADEDKQPLLYYADSCDEVNTHTHTPINYYI
jgi:hypothetical protein